MLSEEVSPRGPPYTTELPRAKIPASLDQLTPIYRVLNNEGVVLDSSQDPNVSLVSKNNAIVPF